ncbi:binding-protein-dependent transport system inner membrane protein [Acrocarpospora pleiomorpha]|uniref:Binding-protein-dependent transport system inner membrane protein n=1 Tax=Acrocarpospora pleiomorpha TaxID=90975 RepID=A0A5M3XVD0_9ACTN|nr:carbohydrate ABC transporter permease [Acrocarpospora pleiomorpha]GES24932.1 binding-protein-dependent transport system inner membrane protein [Acrocarpospora pleiomorpha]
MTVVTVPRHRAAVSRSRRRRIVSVLRRTAVLTLLLLFLAPVLWLLATAFKTRVQIYSADPLNPFFAPSLDNFHGIFSLFQPGKLLFNSLLVASGTTLVALLLGVPAGYALARSESRLTPSVAYVFLFLRMVPPVAALIPFYLLMRDIGLLGTQAALIIISAALNVGFVVWTMWTTFRAIPPVVESAAGLDGCGRFGTFWRISLPLARGGVISSALTVFLFSWNDFLFALLLTNPGTATLPVGMLATVGSVDISIGQMGAFAQIATLPVVLVAIALNRYMVSGIMKGIH